MLKTQCKGRHKGGCEKYQLLKDDSFMHRETGHKLVQNCIDLLLELGNWVNIMYTSAKIDLESL